MKKNQCLMTVSQFASLHNLNKRTLHYYDDIHLFSPKIKKENGYRYYTLEQSVDIEFIKLMKEMNMTIEEISSYMHSPDSDKFLKLTTQKIQDIDEQIHRLTDIKKFLQEKEKQVRFSMTLQDELICEVVCEEIHLSLLPYEYTQDKIIELFSVLKNEWNVNQLRSGIGSYIQVEKLLQNNYDQYDGFFSIADASCSSPYIRKKGRYLSGYLKGEWNSLPKLYKKMLSYAKHHGLELTGYAYEIGMNEFVISNPDEYITNVLIKIKEDDHELHQ